MPTADTPTFPAGWRRLGPEWLMPDDLSAYRHPSGCVIVHGTDRKWRIEYADGAPARGEVYATGAAAAAAVERHLLAAETMARR